MWVDVCITLHAWVPLYCQCYCVSVLDFGYSMMQWLGSLKIHNFMQSQVRMEQAMSAVTTSVVPEHSTDDSSAVSEHTGDTT